MATNEFSFFTCIPMSSFASSSITASYQAVNSNGFLLDIKILRIINNSSSDITISYDGITDHDFIQLGSVLNLSLQSNHACNSLYSSGTLYGRQFQKVYAKGTAGTGNLYVVGYR